MHTRKQRPGRREQAAARGAEESVREAADTVRESYKARASGSESDPALHEAWTEEEGGSDVEERRWNMRLWLEQRKRFEDEWGEEALFDLDMEEEYVARRKRSPGFGATGVNQFTEM